MEDIGKLRDDMIKDLLNLGYVDDVLRANFPEISTFDYRDNRYAIANVLYQIHLNDMGKQQLRDMYLERLEELLIHPITDSLIDPILSLDNFAILIYLDTTTFPEQDNDTSSVCMKVTAEWIAMTIKKLLTASVDDPTSLQVYTIPMTSYDRMVHYAKVRESFDATEDQ